MLIGIQRNLAGAGARLTNVPEIDRQEDAQGMANVEGENTPGPTRGGAAVADSRNDRGGGLKVRPRDDDDRINPDEFKELLESYDNSFRNIAEGEVVNGTGLKVTASEVVVDVGYKAECIIPVDEFLDEAGQVTIQPCDIVDVLLERTEDHEGYVVLSREKAEKMKIWDEVEKAYAERKVVIGRVIERIKGGLAVDIGVRAFLPGSQIDVRPVRNLDALRGQERQGREPHRLRRVRRARAGRRRADPRQRDVVEQAREAPVEDPQRRRHGRSDGAWRGSRRAAHLARSQAGREQSVARALGEVPDRNEDHRQGAQPDRVRRVRRSRGRHRRPDPHLRHVVEQTP